MSGRLVFDTSVFKSENGNLGIGTTSPSALVHIVETGTKPIFRVDDVANDTTPLLIDANGSVGIGTTLPSGATLHLNNPSTNNIFLTSGNATNTITIEDTAFLRFGANQSYKTHVLVVADTYAGGSPGRINFRYLNYLAFDNVNGVSGVGTERFRIDALGNVGIGTTSPLARLHIVETGTRIPFRVDDVASDTTPFIIDAEGNVGIGTTAPLNTLYVYVPTNSVGSTIATFATASGTASSIRIIDSQTWSGGPFNLSDVTSSGIISENGIGLYTGDFSTYASVSPKLFINAAGTVIIGGLANNSVYDNGGLSIEWSKLNVYTQGDSDGGSFATFGNSLDYGTYQRLELLDADTSTGLPVRVKSHSPNGLGLINSSGNGILINNNGNVGIGTTAPRAALEVNGSILPSACNVYNLGSPNFRFNQLFTSGSGIELETARITSTRTNTITVPNFDITGSLDLSLDATNSLILSTSNINVINLPAAAVWGVTVDGTNAEYGAGVTVDSLNNVYLAGTYTTTAATIYNSNNENSGLTLRATSGTNAAYAVKYNSFGIAQWGVSVDGTGADNGNCIAVDNSQNIYLGGNYLTSGPTVYNSNNESSGFTFRNPSGSYAGFAVKYNSFGIAQWGVSVDGTGNDSVQGIAVDSSGNMYIAGQYNAILTLYNPNNVSSGITVRAPTGYSPYAVKYDSSGNVQWAVSVDGAGSTTELGNGVAVDSSGNVYLAGSLGINTTSASVYNSNNTLSTTVNIISNNNTVSAFAVKYNSGGIAQWAVSVNGTGTDEGNAVAVDTSGNVFLAGYYGSNIGTPSALIYNSSNELSSISLPTPAGSYAGYVVKYNPSGIAQWAAIVDGTPNDYASSVTTDTLGNVYIGGYYGASAAVTAYHSTNIPAFTFRQSSGNFAAYLVKYNPNGYAQWGVSLDGTAGDLGNGIAVDASGNVYLGGEYNVNSPTIYNPNNSPSGLTLRTSSGNRAAFVVKYNNQTFKLLNQSSILPGTIKYITNTSISPIPLAIRDANDSLTSNTIQLAAQSTEQLIFNNNTWTSLTPILSPLKGGTGLSNLSQNKLLVGNSTDPILTPTNLHWDPVYNRLGVGTATPKATLDVTGNMSITGNILPSACNVYSIGSSNFRFKDIFLSGNTIDLGGTLISRNVNTGAIVFKTETDEATDITSRNINVNGKLSIGNGIPANAAASAVSLEITGSDALLLPKGTTAQRPTGALGYIRYNIELDTFEGYGAGNAWGSLGGVKSTDQFTYVTAENDSNIRFFTGTQQRMVINPNGNVGIGTTNPLVALQINSTNAILLPKGATNQRPAGQTGLIRYNTELNTFEGYGAGNAWGSLGGVKSTDQNTYITADNDNTLRFFTAAQQQAIMNASGNLGIGTTNPLTKLHIIGTVTADTINATTVSAAITGNASTATTLQTSRTLWGQSFDGSADVSGNITNAGTIQFGTQVNKGTLTYTTNTARTFTVPDPGANADFVMTSGNQSIGGLKVFPSSVGIGTTVARQSLDVIGDVQFSGTLQAGTIPVGRLSGTLPVANGGTGQTSLTANKVLVGNNTSGILQPANLHWDNTNSRLGINNQFPSNALDVVGNAYVSGTITASNLSIIGDFVTMNTVTSNTEQVVITNLGTGPALRVIQTGNTPLAEFFDNESGSAMFIDNNGLIGFSTNVPLAKLYVLETGTVDAFRVDDQASDTTPFIIKADGLVGIGKTNPGTALDVNGTVTATAFSGPLTGNATNVTGTVAVANGGTGQTTLTANKVLVGNTTTGILQPANLHWDNTNSRLGVGTTTPGADTLRVQGTIKATAAIDTDTQFLGQANDTAAAPSFSFTSDTNTGMFRGGTDILAFSTAGTQRVTLDSVGNVGVGVTNPQTMLDINGSQLTRNSTVYQIASSGWYNIGLWDCSVGTGGSSGQRLRLELIGGNGYDNSLGGSLDFGGVTTIYASILNNLNTTTIANINGSWRHDGARPCISDCKFVQNSTNRNQYFVYVNLNNFTQHALRIDTTQGSMFTPSFTSVTDPGANSLTVQAATFSHILGYNGNSTGIGTTTPNAPLQIVSNSTSTLLRVTQTNVSNRSGISFSHTSTGDLNIQQESGGTAIFENFGGQGFDFYARTANGRFIFRTTDSNTERVRIVNSGNVGIGTATPIELLNVEGNIALSGAARFVGTRTNHNLSLRTNNTNRITIDTNGNVGIGSATPVAPLDVVGNARVSGTVTAAGLTISNTIFNTIQVSGGGGIRIDGSSGQSALSIGGNGILGIDAPGITFGRFVVRDDGNVGIGTTFGRQKLDVVGTVQATAFSGPLTGNVTGTATGLAGTPNITVGTVSASAVTASGAVYSNRGTTASFYANQGVMATTDYNFILGGINDASGSVVMFINGSARTADGGANTLTFRNDGGAIRIGTTTYATSFEGSSFSFAGGAITTNNNNINAGSGTIGSGAITSTGAISGTTLTSTVASGTAPLTVTSTTLVTNLNAQLFDSVSSVTRSACHRAQRNITGGGTITVDASGNVLWSARFIVISNGSGANFSTGGYFDITCPTSGTITGVGGSGNVTATAAGIPVAAWSALYYILPIGSSQTSLAANFRIVSYTAALDVPHTWLLICVRNGDSGVFYFPNDVTLRLNQSIDTATYDARRSQVADQLNTAQTLTIGSTGKTFNGTAGVSWNLTEIGAAATAQTMHIGTTAVAINRGSANLALTGITSIDGTAANVTGIVAIANGGTGNNTGNAATVTNGVYTTGNQTIGGIKTFSDRVVIGSTTYATATGYMAAGTISIGNTNANYGGGTSQWNANTAGLMLECATNTEIAVHDAATRVASLMFYNGDANNTITIGRDMGWGASAVLIPSNLTVNGTLTSGALTCTTINTQNNNISVGTGTVTAATFSGTATSVTNGVYTTGDQTIGGTKTFSSTISGSINGNAATVGGISANNLFNNMGANHGDRSDFNTIPNFGTYYVTGATNGPDVNSATQYYAITLGLGANYPWTGAGSYGVQIAIPRAVSNPYIAIRYNENNSLAAWQRISAGYADSAGSVSQTLTRGSYLTGNNYNGSAATTWAVDATAAATASKVVARDSSGDINVRLVRSTFANQATAVTGAMAYRVNNSTDNYIRFCSDASPIRDFLNVPSRTGANASGTWGISISGSSASTTGNAATVTNGVYTTGDQTIGGTKTFSSTVRINNSEPTIVFQDTDHNSGFLHCNSSLLYVLRGANNSTSWTAVNGQWPFIFNLGNNNGTCGNDLFAVGNITAYSSDKRLKINIRPIQKALDKISKLNGVFFDWIPEVNAMGFHPKHMQNDAGLLAQEVQEVLAQAISPAPFDQEYVAETNTYKSKSGENYLTVQYEKLVPLLVESIKELKQEKDTLTQEVKDLKQELQDLKQLVQNLIR